MGGRLPPIVGVGNVPKLEVLINWVCSNNVPISFSEYPPKALISGANVGSVVISGYS